MRRVPVAILVAIVAVGVIVSMVLVSKQPMNIRTASAGVSLKEAEQMLGNEYDAYVIDIMLHEAGGSRDGGINFAKKIREFEKKNKKRRAPIVFATILGDNPGTRRTIETEKLTDHEILTKPFPMPTLVKILNDALTTKNR